MSGGARAPLGGTAASTAASGVSFTPAAQSNLVADVSLAPPSVSGDSTAVVGSGGNTIPGGGGAVCSAAAGGGVPLPAPGDTAASGVMSATGEGGAVPSCFASTSTASLSTAVNTGYIAGGSLQHGDGGGGMSVASSTALSSAATAGGGSTGESGGGFVASNCSGSTNAASLFRLARHAAVTAFREALMQEQTRQRQLIMQQDPNMSVADVESRVQEVLRSSFVDPTSLSTILFEVAQRANDDEAVAVTQLLVDELPLVDPTQRDRMQQDCLFYAAREGHVRLCEYLLRHGCSPNARDTVGQTCLFYAAREGRAAAIAILVDAGGADPNIIDINRQTCLFYAARDNRLDAVCVLLQRGADPHVKDALRKTAWHFARANNHTAVCSVLKAAAGGPASAAAAAAAVCGGSSASFPLLHSHMHPSGASHSSLPATGAVPAGGASLGGSATATTPAVGGGPAGVALPVVMQQQYAAPGEADVAAARRSSSGSARGGAVGSDATARAAAEQKPQQTIAGAPIPAVGAQPLGLPDTGSAVLPSVATAAALQSPTAAAAGTGAQQPHGPPTAAASDPAAAGFAGRSYYDGRLLSAPGGLEQQQTRRKYRLQFQPLPEEHPDLWLFAGTEKLTEFERLFPTLSVWQKSEVPGGPPPAPSRMTGGASSSSSAGDSSAAAATNESQNHYESVHWALMQNCVSKHASHQHHQHVAEGQQQNLDILGKWHAAASALLSQLSRYEGGHIFEKPVDPKIAPGYYDVVTRPMSLSTIKSKLKKNEYTHPSQFLQDVEQVFINCEIYNQRGTWVWSIGKNMQKFFANRVRMTNFKEYVDLYDKINNVLAVCHERNIRHSQEQQKSSTAPSSSSSTSSASSSSPPGAPSSLPPQIESAPGDASGSHVSEESTAAAVPSAANCTAATTSAPVSSPSVTPATSAHVAASSNVLRGPPAAFSLLPPVVPSSPDAVTPVAVSASPPVAAADGLLPVAATDALSITATAMTTSPHAAVLTPSSLSAVINVVPSDTSTTPADSTGPAGAATTSTTMTTITPEALTASSSSSSAVVTSALAEGVLGRSDGEQQDEGAVFATGGASSSIPVAESEVSTLSAEDAAPLANFTGDTTSTVASATVPVPSTSTTTVTKTTIATAENTANHLPAAAAPADAPAGLSADAADAISALTAASEQQQVQHKGAATRSDERTHASDETAAQSVNLLSNGGGQEGVVVEAFHELSPEADHYAVKEEQTSHLKQQQQPQALQQHLATDGAVEKKRRRAETA